MTVNFTARPIANYKAFSNADAKSLTVYELETRDIDFLKGFKEKINKSDAFNYLREKNPVNHEIVDLSLTSIINALKIKDKFKVDDKSVAYLAVVNNKACSLMQGNLPKIDLKNNKVVHSTRNHSKETEIDWLSVIPQNENNTPKSSAASVMAEFFNYCKKMPSDIKSIYCRSEIPERCDKSVKFYKKLGFKPISDNYVELSKPTYPLELNSFLDTDSFEYPKDEVLPLALSIKKASESFEHISKKFARERLDNSPSVDLNTVIKD